MAGQFSFSQADTSELLWRAIQPLHAAYSGLPRELSDEISSYLSEADILSLSEVSRSIREAMIPHLQAAMYRSVSFEIDNTGGACAKQGTVGRTDGTTWELGTTRIHHFLRTILGRPELALYVQEFRIFWSPSIGLRWFENLTIPNFPEQDLAAATLSLPAVPPETGDEWGQSLREHRLVAILPLVVSCLKNVRLFRLPYGLILESQEFLLQYFAAYGHEFEYLEHLDLAGRSTGCRYFHFDKCSWELFQPFFSPPRLKKVIVALPLLKEDTEGVMTASATPSVVARHLTSLQLKRGRSSGKDLDRILACCPSLKNLHIISDWDGYSAIRGDDLSRALRHVASTLETLAIMIHTEHVMYAGDEYDGHDDPGCGSLAFLESLQSLEIPPDVLFGWSSDSRGRLSSILPSTLEYLCLREDLIGMDRYQWDMPALLEALREFLGAGDARMACPSLNRMVLKLLHFRRRMDDSRLAAQAEFPGLCEQNGISCSVAELEGL